MDLWPSVCSWGIKIPFMQEEGSKSFLQEKSGFLLQNCSFTISPEFTEQQGKGIALLGRAWGKYSTVIVMESWLDSIIDPRGWDKWDKSAIDLLSYLEFSNRGPASNTSARVSWAKVLPDAAAAKQYTLTIYIDGDKWIPGTGIPYYGGFATLV
ncbi:Pectinesterase, catalytic [Corchorus capsularis]|uniref:Pectinesterase, catalytic n=1 Tax=Corchorus capsularis TaxID=210143 RepID=A0A1R3IZD1_COCAP|nr:Pectinesterase, catalytic [Corchorus capsularis]